MRPGHERTWIVNGIGAWVLCAAGVLANVVAAGELRGYVRDASTGQPIANAVVTAQGQISATNRQGAFVIEADTEQIQARAPGYRAMQQRWTGKDVVFDLSPFRPRAVYLSTFGVADASLRTAAERLVEQGAINALVIDAKGDRGQFSYPSPAGTGANAHTPVAASTTGRLQSLVARWHERGVYLIARIVVFKDDPLAATHPEWTVRLSGGEVWRDHEQSRWIDPSIEDAWSHYADIAEEVAQIGFDEIQLDYVRFPDAQGLAFATDNTQANRRDAIHGFLRTIRKRLTPYNVFLSADVFGYVCWNRNDTGIGQQLEDLGDVVDYVSPMLYPSSFTWGISGLARPTDDPGQIVLRSLAQAQARTGWPGLRFRPWLQAFRDYAFDHRAFGPEELDAQMRAADAMRTDGWMLWNPRNQYPDVPLAVDAAAPSIDDRQ